MLFLICFAPAGVGRAQCFAPAGVVHAQACGDGSIEGSEACDEGASNGTTTCGCALDCTYLGALFHGDLVMADPREVDPLLDPIVIGVDPATGVQTPLSIGGFLTEPR